MCKSLRGANYAAHGVGAGFFGYEAERTRTNAIASKRSSAGSAGLRAEQLRWWLLHWRRQKICFHHPSKTAFASRPGRPTSAAGASQRDYSDTRRRVRWRRNGDALATSTRCSLHQAVSYQEYERHRLTVSKGEPATPSSLSNEIYKS